MIVPVSRGMALAAPAAGWFAACLALSALFGPACAQTAPPWPGNDHADPIRPDPRLTPGAVATSDPGVFCHAGYSRSVRHTSGRVKRQVYRAYGIDRRSGSCETDHLVPLAIGGSDEAASRKRNFCLARRPNPSRNLPVPIDLIEYDSDHAMIHNTLSVLVEPPLTGNCHICVCSTDLNSLGS